jgi:tetratricopeptide (TPR) repeat protein
VVAAQQFAQRRNDQALKGILAQAQEWPDDPYVLRWGAHLCGWVGASECAESFWRRLLIVEDATDARVALARLALQRGKLQEADDHVTALLAQSPMHGEGWLLRGVLAMQRQAYSSALSAFEAALAHGGDAKKARMGCGMAEMGQGHADQAWNHFSEVLVADPDHADAIHWLLRAGTALERWDGLFNHLSRFTLRNPADLAARFALAGVAIRLGRRDVAGREYDAVRLLNPAYDGLDALATALACSETCVIPHAD